MFRQTLHVRTDLKCPSNPGARVAESAHFNYKREIYEDADAYKKQPLIDIPSFANKLGGHLIVIMYKDDGSAPALVPLTGLGIDQELQWRETMVRTETWMRTAKHS